MLLLFGEVAASELNTGSPKAKRIPLCVHSVKTLEMISALHHGCLSGPQSETTFQNDLGYPTATSQGTDSLNNKLTAFKWRGMEKRYCKE